MSPSLKPQPKRPLEMLPSQWKVWREHVADMIDQEIESLNLYEPMPHQDFFHRQTCKEVLMLKGNRVGGTVGLMVELARALTGQDPYGKYPPRDGIASCIVFGEKHVGRVLHENLFRWGAFDIIRDRVTDKWRTFRPWEPNREKNGKFGDFDRVEEKRPAPPLIPKRFIKKFAWEKMAMRVFAEVSFVNGWRLYAHNSQGDPSHAQGYAANLVAIDEDVAMPGWLVEMIGRLSMPPGTGKYMKTGLLRWAGLPHQLTEDMTQMYDRSLEEAEQDNPRTVCIEVAHDENLYLSDETKEENRRIWMSAGEDVYKRRWEGKLDVTSTLMYPGFSKTIHRAEIGEEDETAPLALRLLAKNNYVPPVDWCNYWSFDPGSKVGAVQFVTVPPPNLGDWVIAFTELYIRNCTAQIWGRELKERVKRLQFQDQIIDAHGARLREQASGILPRTQYQKVMEELKIGCVARGARFRNGSDNIEGRELAMKTALGIRDTGKQTGFPRFMVVMHKCPNFVREMLRFKHKTMLRGGNVEIMEDGNRRYHTHLIEATEMLIAHGTPYMTPMRNIVKLSASEMSLQEDRMWKSRERYLHGKHKQTGITLGPQGA